MLRGTLVGTLSAVLVAACTPAEQRPANGSVRISIQQTATTYSLANGLEVILVENHRTPFVALHLRYHAGSKDDPKGREGLAHLYEHMTFGGARHIARDDVLPSLERLGARSYNGTTSRDHTDYYETVPTGAMEAALWLEADRMRTAAEVFDDAMLAREKDIVQNERKMTIETAPLGDVPAIVADAFYPAGHPYHHVPIGTTEAVNATTLDELRAFHDRHYVPENATLALVGDFELARAKSLVEKYFGPAAAAKTSPPPRRFATITSAATRRIRVDANVSYGSVRVAWPLPPPGQPGYYESWAALVLATWTIDSRSVEKKVAHAVTSRFDPARLGTIGEVRAVLDPGATADAFIDIVTSVLDGLGRARHLTYLPDLRSELIGSTVFAQEWLTDRASRAQSYDEAYGDANYVMTELNKVGALSSENVTDAYSSFFPIERALVTVIVPNPQAPLAGRREP